MNPVLPSDGGGTAALGKWGDQLPLIIRKRLLCHLPAWE